MSRFAYPKEIKLHWFAAFLSVITLVFYHTAFYKHVFCNVEPTFNGFVIVASLITLMLVANYFAYYLILYITRFIGRIILSVAFILNSISLYFINTYEVMLDDSMMGNVFNTNYTEATSYFSGTFVIYTLLLGIVPAIIILYPKIKINYGTIAQAGKHIGCSIAFILVVAFANAPNWLWIDKNAPVIGSYLLPWSYTVNSIRYHNQQKAANRAEIILPDATILDDDKEMVLLIIGESARRDHFALYGYDRPTNPELSQRNDIRTFIANSSATYTTAGVKAILEYKESDELYEVLPNYLNRNGVDVTWRTSNWGEPPLHIEKYIHDRDLQPNKDSVDFDETLLIGLREQILASGKNKVFIVLHTSTSHGPSYYKKYPSQFEVMTPVCTSVELAECSHDELINAYDNTIIYTDHIINSAIEVLASMKEWKSAMIYVSDHGESLGEKNLYMHGVPMSLAPKEQYEIPFIVWTSEGSRTIKDSDTAEQHNVFHSVLDFLSLDSSILDKGMSLFE